MLLLSAKLDAVQLQTFKISCFAEWYRVLILFAKQHYLYSVDVHSQTTETQHEIDVWKRLDVIIMISSKVNFL